MTHLDVPGARLYYETRGQGPLLILIAGANGSADGYRWLADHLAAHHTVVTYDRRGFSRSTLDGPPNDAHRLATDAEDVRRLIQHAGDEPAIVFGASSGGIVLELLTRHPGVARAVVAFEPPAMRLLPDGQQWLDFFHLVYDRYRDAGIQPAMTMFRERAFPPTDQQVMLRAPRDDANATYWFEHELRQYPAVDLDMDALAPYAGRILLAMGRDSRGYPARAVTVALGAALGRDVVELPGGHVGHVSHPAEFARALLQALAPAGHPPTT